MSGENPTPPADPKGGNNPNPNPGNGTDPKNENPDNKDGVDLSKLSDEQFSKLFDDERVWKHPRFKQLSDEAKAGRQAKKDKEEAEAKKLEEQGEYQKLLESERAKNKELLLSQQIQAAAIKAGAVDVEAVTKLIDRNAITVNDDGTITGVDEAVSSLLESKAYLKGDGSNTPPPSVGSGANPPADPNTQGKYKFKHSQIQDSKFYAEHEAEILEAMKNNQIEADIPF